MDRGYAGKSINSRTVFYSITLLSIIMFIMGLSMNPSISDNVGKFIGLKEGNFDFATYLVILPFCIWAWLIITGLLFVKKNWLVISICLVLLIPHIILIAVYYGYSYGLIDILKRYVSILTFGLVVL